MQTIETHYIDGISLTHGKSPREHIWTFAAAVYLLPKPCLSMYTNTRTIVEPEVPPFVGKDYFCDIANENCFQLIFFEDDPLWDGAGCGQFNTCCTFNSTPWFLKELSCPTIDPIEMRLYADQTRDDEDITFEKLELYVQ